MPADRPTVWIDFENTPHIPFFAPIIRELEQHDIRVVLSARDAYQTCQMADLYRMQYSRIGRHYGQKLLLKALGLAVRTSQLIPFARRHRPAIGLSHGSRSQVIACNLLGIPSVMLEDYEHSHGVGFGHPRWLMLPDALSSAPIARSPGVNVRFYSGIKEDVYVPEFVADPSLPSSLGIENDALIVTVRPPATEAHYHCADSDRLYQRAMERFLRYPGLRVVLLPRNHRQDAALRRQFPHWFAGTKVIVPHQVIPGLNLLWHSDLVVSGGGTMNREAAALGVPVYSVFRGEIGAVDRRLQSEGRLVLIESEADVDTRIRLERRPKQTRTGSPQRPALRQIVTHLEEILATGRS